MNDGPIPYRRRELHPIVAIDDLTPKTDAAGRESPALPAPPPMKRVTPFVPSAGGSAEPDPEVQQVSGGGRDPIGRRVRRATKRIREAAKYVGMILPARHPVPEIDGLPDGDVIDTVLLEEKSKTWWLHGGSCGQVHDLCRRSPVNRPFYHRPASWGGRLGCTATGFLLKETGTKGERLVATTLHALAGLANPKEGKEKVPNYIVFGFLDHPDNGWVLRVGGVVKIKSVYARGRNTVDPGEDWALLEVDAAAHGCDGDKTVREADRLDLSSGLEFHPKPLDEDDKLVIVSHSLSLSKSFGVGRVIDIADRTFSHDCDTLGGSSGAPLLKRDKKSNTLKVVGMCVRGGHLRSTPTGGAEPIPIGDPTEPFFGANVAVQLTNDSPARTVDGKPAWPGELPIEHAPAAGGEMLGWGTVKLHVGAEIGNDVILDFKLERRDVVTLEAHVKVTSGNAWQLHWGKAVSTVATDDKGKPIKDAGGSEIKLVIRPW